MDLSFLSDYYIPVVLVACLVVGYCIKHITWLDKIANEYIPAILAVLGAVLAVLSAYLGKSPVTLETVVYGAFTGLASTGLHQAFTQIINKSSKEGTNNESERSGSNRRQAVTGAVVLQPAGSV